MQRRLLFFLTILFLATRIYGIERLPLFSDEAYAILQSEKLRHGAPLLGMIKNSTQPVFIWLVALLQYVPFNHVVTGRLVSMLAGLVTAWMLALISKQWIDHRTSTIAFLITLLLPFSFFYDRTVLFESTVGSAIALSLFFPIIGIPLAILVKQTGWLALPLIFLTHRKIKTWFWTITAAFVIPLVVWTLAFGSVSGLQSVLMKTSSAPISTRADMKSNLLRSKIWLRTYLTDPVIAIAFLGMVVELVISVKKKTISPLLGVALWTGGVVLFESAIARIFYPRYLYPVVIGVILLTTRGIWTVLETLRHVALQQGSDLSKDLILPSFVFNLLVLPVLLFLLFLPSLRFDFLLLTNPNPPAAPLALEDRFQFYEDWTSGAGSQELANAIRAYQRDNPGKLTVYLEEENSYAVTLSEELKKKQIENEIEIEIGDWLMDPLTDIPDEIRANVPYVLFVRNRNPDIPTDWPVEKIFSFNKTAVREVSLYRVVEGSDLSKDRILP